MSQEDAVVLFHKQSDEGTPVDITANKDSLVASAKPIIQLYNPALFKLTGIELLSEKSAQN